MSDNGRFRQRDSSDSLFIVPIVLDGARIREAILKMDLNTVFGAFKVDRDGVRRSPTRR